MLFFKGARQGGLFCEQCTHPTCCAKGAHRGEPLFTALVIANMRKHMTVAVMVRCFEHIPAGSMVDGEIKIDVPAPPTEAEMATLPVLDMDEFEKRGSMPVRQAPPWRRKKA